MAGNKMREQTREKILLAAREEFLNKGFENAKMEDIAAGAGVTKVMLYYHFNTKQNIFREIIIKTVDEIKAEFLTRMTPADLSNPEDFQTHLQSMVDFYRTRQRTLRMILSEYLSHQEMNKESLSIFGDFFRLLFELAGKDQSLDHNSLLVRVFFFNALPMIMYACMEDTFCQNFAVPAGEAQTVFIDTFTRSFMQNVNPSGK